MMELSKTEKIDGGYLHTTTSAQPMDAQSQYLISTNEQTGKYTLEDLSTLCDAILRHFSVKTDDSTKIPWALLSAYVPWTARECQKMWRFMAYQCNEPGSANILLPHDWDLGDIDDNESVIEEENTQQYISEDSFSLNSTTTTTLSQNMFSLSSPSTTSPQSAADSKPRPMLKFSMSHPGVGYRSPQQETPVSHTEGNFVAPTAPPPSQSPKYPSPYFHERKARRARPNPWTPEEDYILLKGIKTYGAGSWSKIHTHMNLDRNSSQMNQRWERIKKRVRDGGVTDEFSISVVDSCG